MLLGELFRRNARRYPQKTALVFEETRITYKELNCRINRLANALLDLGVKKGDRACVLLDNCPEFIEIYFGCTPKIGLIMAALNNMASEAELLSMIRDMEPDTLFVGENYLGVVNSLWEELKTIKNFIVVGTPPKEMKGYEELLSSASEKEPGIEIHEDDLAYIIYTSGTTGLPKGLMQSHRSMTEMTLNCLFTTDNWDVVFLYAPLFWGGTYSILLPTFYKGGTLLLMRGWDTNVVLELAQKEKVTLGILMVNHIDSLINHPRFKEYDLSSWRVIVVGGTALLAEVWKRGIKALGNIFLHVYASLETGWLTALRPDEVNPEGSPEEVKRMTSCGQEVMNMEVKVVDEDDNEVRPGDPGEVIAKGDALMKGYWRKPYVTEEAMKGGWFHTGDMGTMDEKGYLYLLGRKKDTIISGGKLLFPAEIEDVLYRHPAIEAAAVIGEPHEKLGEVAKAIVTLRGTTKVTPEEIIEFCQQSLPDYAIPRSVEFADTLPRTPAGKVLKRALRDKYLS